MIMVLLALLAAYASSFLLCSMFRKPGSFLYLLDQPNQRSLHKVPIPRTGGIAIMSGVAIGALVLILLTGLPLLNNQLFLLGLLIVIGTSLVDDFRQLSATIRLLLHFASAVLLILGFGVITGIDLPVVGLLEFGFLGLPLSLLFIVWMMNLYNFMDGIDGLAGLMGVIGFGTIAIIGLLEHNMGYFGAALIVSVSCLAFLNHNFPPARIFMGDVGSISIGYLISAFCIWGIKEELLSVVEVMIIFAPFILDATVTLFLRIIRREKVWHAHNNHFYQRLVKRGASHRQVFFLEAGLMLICGGGVLYFH